MAKVKMGSYEGDVQNGDDLLAVIYNDIEAKTGAKITNKKLKHITIWSENANLFEINGFEYEIKNSVFATPNNDNSDLLIIDSFKALQDCHVVIYYIR